MPEQAAAAAAVAEEKADSRQDRAFQHSWIVVTAIGVIAAVIVTVATLTINAAIAAGAASARLDSLEREVGRHSTEISDVKGIVVGIKTSTDFIKDWLAAESKKHEAKP